MGRKAGVPNKVTTEVKEKLEELIDGIVNSIVFQVVNSLMILFDYIPD